MKKIVKTVILVAAFTTATIFMSCSDAISEDKQEQNIEATSKLEEYSLLKNCTHKIIRKTDIFTDTKNRQNTREIVYAACFI